MLLPYQVDRPVRRVPRFTYGLIAINVAVYLLTVLIANLNLPADREAAQESIEAVMRQIEDDEQFASGSDEGGGSTLADQPPGAGATGPGQSAPGQAEPGAPQQPPSIAEQYRRAWQIEHSNDSFVLEPHPSTLDVFAYHAASPTLLGMLCSMFLHGGLDHLLGNMLMLWVFGRALEDALGAAVYLGAYLVCGVAATLLFHIMTMQFAPQSAGVHALGASGAIAGVLGLFAPRFYRTPVHIFYLNFMGLRIFSLASAILGFTLAKMMGTPGYVLAGLIVLTALIVLGEDATWGSFEAAAAWAIGGWLVLQNLLPAMLDIYLNRQGGVAHWAHIGGLGFGVLYALLIGSKSEGKTEYLMEDARKSLEKNYATNALEYAQDLIKHQPNNPAAYELLAEAYSRKKNEDAALDSYELAINIHLEKGDRSGAARVYLSVLKKYPLFILPPATQFVLGSQMSKNGDCQNAAETLCKIPFTFPDAPEGELSLLHSAQIYLNHLNEPQMTKHLLETLLQRYPQSEWLAQAQKGIQLAERRMAEAQAAELQTGAPPSTFPNASASAPGGAGVAGVAGAPPAPTFTPSIRKLSETRPPQ